MKTREVPIDSYVSVHGKPATAKAMGITRQRVQQMTTNADNVFLRVSAANGSRVLGWYIYREMER